MNTQDPPILNDHLSLSICTQATPFNEMDIVKLKEIWASVLGIEVSSIQLTDNFFSLGGHSLSLMHLINILAEHYQPRLTIKDFMLNPTIAFCLSKFSPDKGQITQSSEALANFEVIPLAYMQKQMLIYETLFKDNNYSYNIPFVYKITGKLDISRLEKAISAVIQRHDALRSCFKEENGFTKQIILNSADFRIIHTAVDKLILDKLIDQKIHVRFDVSIAPLLKVDYLTTSDGQFLIFVLHHLITDYISIQIFFKEVSEHYIHSQHSQATPFQYKAYLNEINTYKQSQEYSAVKKYWLKRLDNYKPPVSFGIKIDLKYSILITVEFVILKSIQIISNL